MLYIYVVSGGRITQKLHATTEPATSFISKSHVQKLALNFRNIWKIVKTLLENPAILVIYYIARNGNHGTTGGVRPTKYGSVRVNRTENSFFTDVHKL